MYGLAGGAIPYRKPYSYMFFECFLCMIVFEQLGLDSRNVIC